jgi:PLP dependent protein
MQDSLRERWDAVRERISAACAKAGRAESEVLLLAVTKVFPSTVIEEAYALGMREFGENYVQEFERKRPLLPELPGARFHLIGHLQSNKAKKAGELFDVVQTIDGPKLARRLDELGKPMEVMVEVKLSDEEAKHGCDPAELAAVVEAIRGCANLTLTGLMTIPPWDEDAEKSRPYFARLRELAVEHGLTGLSMGMSNDLEVAIQEGSTIVRVGTALFGRRQKA